MLDEGRAIGARRENPEQRWIHPQNRRAERPNRQQHDLAAEIEADLDVLLVLMGGVVDFVVALRLKEKVASLPANHCHKPAN